MSAMFAKAFMEYFNEEKSKALLKITEQSPYHLHWACWKCFQVCPKDWYIENKTQKKR